MSTTCPEPRARGFALISAIFLLVVIGGLAAYLLTMSNVQQTTATTDLLGTRAYQAARGGIAWGAWQVRQNPAYACTTATSASDTVVLPAALADFATTVTCSRQSFDEAGATVNVYRLTATATLGSPASPAYVERQLTAVLTQ